MATELRRLAPDTPSVIAAAVVANQTTGTTANNLAGTLNLRQKEGARLIVRIGRRVATALTRPAFVAVRFTDNSTLTVPSGRLDSVQSSATTAAAATTLSANAAADAMSIAVNGITNFAVGDAICISDSGGARISFNQIARIDGLTLHLVLPLQRSHNQNDDVTNLAHVHDFPIPSGDIYRISVVNNSGQAIVAAVDAIVDNGVEVVTT